MLPDLGSLDCFVTAARLLNFRQAAEQVSLTPAALGKRIQNLELQLGAPLFHRTTRHVQLTERGLAFLPFATKLLEDGRGCIRAGRGEVGPVSMEMVIGSRHELGLSWVLPMFDSFDRAYPHITFHLYIGSGPDLELRVRTNELDCAITSRPQNDPKLHGIRLLREDYLFVASPKLLKKSPLVKADDAEGHTLLDSQRSLPLFEYWRSAARGGGHLSFERIVVLGTIAAIRDQVISGRGVAVNKFLSGEQ